MEALAIWLEASTLSLAIQSTAWVVPTVQSLHVMALAIIMTAMVMLDVRLIGLAGKGQSLHLSQRRFVPVLWRLLPVAALTGAILIVGEPRRELLNTYFWTKMAMLLTAVMLTLLVRPLLEDRPLGEVAAPKALAIRAVGAVSLLLWLGIVFCGRWIAYG